MSYSLPNWAEIVSAISACVSVIISLVLAWMAFRQYSRSKKLEYQEKRPFVIPTLVLEGVDGEERLFLSIKNVGDTPARNIVLDIESKGAWNWVKDPDYTFIGHPGISAIGPNDSIRYFLGVIRKGNPLHDITTREVYGKVSFDHPLEGEERIVDNFRTSLVENRYRTK